MHADFNHIKCFDICRAPKVIKITYYFLIYTNNVISYHITTKKSCQNQTFFGVPRLKWVVVREKKYTKTIGQTFLSGWFHRNCYRQYTYSQFIIGLIILGTLHM